MEDMLTEAELRYWTLIVSKDSALRALLSDRKPGGDALAMFDYLVAVKNTLGNLNNDMSFVASLLVKPFLRKRFEIDFDAALKPQGAPGMDIDCTLPDGTRIVGELKTTKPYQSGFGAAQKREITKDLLRLAGTAAAHRFMFVTDADSFLTICKPSFASLAPGVEVVDLVRGECFVCRAGRAEGAGGIAARLAAGRDAD
jgi:hypothetical protein